MVHLACEVLPDSEKQGGVLPLDDFCGLDYLFDHHLFLGFGGFRGRLHEFPELLCLSSGLLSLFLSLVLLLLLGRSASILRRFDFLLLFLGLIVVIVVDLDLNQFLDSLGDLFLDVDYPKERQKNLIDSRIITAEHLACGYGELIAAFFVGLRTDHGHQVGELHEPLVGHAA